MTDASTVVRSLPDRDGDLGVYATSFRLHLEAENDSPRTIQSYMEGLAQFDEFLEHEGLPRMVADIRSEHVKAFVVDLLGREKPNGETYSPATARARLAAVRSFYAWLVDEDDEDIDSNPAAGVRFPKNPERVMRIPTDDEVGALLKSCTGKDFDARRDMAICSLFADNGVRLSGLADLKLEDVDLGHRLLYVTLKGGRQQPIPFGRDAARALDRYLRARAHHSYADLPWLWVSSKGRFTSSGIGQMVRRRWQDLGVTDLSAHSLRRYMAHSKLASGDTEGNVMATGGWTDASMVRRYARGQQVERAAAAHEQHSPLDRLRGRR